MRISDWSSDVCSSDLIRTRAAPSRALSCARADWGRSAALRRRQDHEDRRPGNVSPAKRSWPAERFGLARQASRRFLIVTSHGGRILLEIAQDFEFELFGCQWVAENGFERARPEGATSEQFGFFAGQCVGYRQLVAIDQSC